MSSLFWVFTFTGIVLAVSVYPQVVGKTKAYKQEFSSDEPCRLIELSACCKDFWWEHYVLAAWTQRHREEVAGITFSEPFDRNKVVVPLVADDVTLLAPHRKAREWRFTFRCREIRSASELAIAKLWLGRFEKLVTPVYRIRCPLGEIGRLIDGEILNNSPGSVPLKYTSGQCVPSSEDSLPRWRGRRPRTSRSSKKQKVTTDKKVCIAADFDMFDVTPESTLIAYSTTIVTNNEISISGSNEIVVPRTRYIEETAQIESESASIMDRDQKRSETIHFADQSFVEPEEDLVLGELLEFIYQDDSQQMRSPFLKQQDGSNPYLELSSLDLTTLADPDKSKRQNSLRRVKACVRAGQGMAMEDMTLHVDMINRNAVLDN